MQGFPRQADSGRKLSESTKTRDRTETNDLNRNEQLMNKKLGQARREAGHGVLETRFSTGREAGDQTIYVISKSAA